MQVEFFDQKLFSLLKNLATILLFGSLEFSEISEFKVS